MLPTTSTTDMAVTRSRSKELQRQQEENRERSRERNSSKTNAQEVLMATPTPDSRRIPQTYRRVIYDSLLSFDDVQPEDIQAITWIPWFLGTAVEEDVEKDFEHLTLYAWDDEFHWDV